jgi:hypothetical protein
LLTGQSLSADRQAAGLNVEMARQSLLAVITQLGFAVPVADEGCQAEAWRYRILTKATEYCGPVRRSM